MYIFTNNQGEQIMNKTEEMKRMEADMSYDKELHNKFCTTIDRIASEGKVESDGELFAKAASELGYSIAAAEFERLDAEREEVSLDEPEMAAGGNEDEIKWCFYDYRCEGAFKWKPDEHGHDSHCITAWHCFTATLHSSTDTKNVACMKDYVCAFVYHKS